MRHPSPAEFRIEGEVLEFLMTLQGKWRLVLKTMEGEHHQMKITKALRNQLRATLQPGMLVRVSGFSERKRFATQLLMTITECGILLSDSDGYRVHEAELLCSGCPIEVCAKKNCWKSGGREVYEALYGELESAGLAGTIRVKKVGCLDNCKRGPNILHGQTLYERCSEKTAELIVSKIARPDRPFARRGPEVGS